MSTRRGPVAAGVAAGALLTLPGLHPSGSSASPPDWAAAGFVTYKCGDSLCVIRPDGSGERGLLNARAQPHPWPQWDAAFAPGGGVAAFRGYFAPGDGDYALYSARTGGCGVRRLTRSIAGNPTWSPDGRWIAFDTSGYGVIWKVRRDGTARTRIVGSGGADYDASPAWSPTGRTIAFIHYHRGKGELWIVGADGRHPRLLHRDPAGSVGSPVWSHDGTRIAFSDQTARGKSRVEVVGTDGANRRALTGADGEVWNPSWLPGDRGIAYLGRDGTTGELFVVRPTGGNPTPLALPKTSQFVWVAGSLPHRC